MAVPWLLLDQGAGPALAGSAYAVTLVPYIVLGLLAGAVGDRMGRRRLMSRSHALQTVGAAVIPIWAIFGAPPIGVIFAAVLAVGCGRVFADAASFGALESIVGADNFTRGQAVLGAAWGIGFFAGPAAAGALIPVIGPAATLAVETVALALATGAVVAIRVPFAVSVESRARLRPAIAEGFHAIWRDPAIRAYTLVAATWMLATGGAHALLVPLFRDAVGLSAGEAGAAFAVGALMGLGAPPALAALERHVTPSQLVIALMAITTVAVAVLASAAALGTVIGGVVLLELSGAALAALLTGERQRRAASSLQARVGITGRTIVLTATTLGAAIASVLVHGVGLRTTYWVMAAAGAAVALGAGLVLARATGRAA